MTKEVVSIKLDADLVKAAEELFSDLGLDLNTAVNIFLRQSLRVHGIPFIITEEATNVHSIESK